MRLNSPWQQKIYEFCRKFLREFKWKCPTLDRRFSIKKCFLLSLVTFMCCLHTFKCKTYRRIKQILACQRGSNIQAEHIQCGSYKWSLQGIPEVFRRVILSERESPKCHFSVGRILMVYYWDSFFIAFIFFSCRFCLHTRDYSWVTSSVS